MKIQKCIFYLSLIFYLFLIKKLNIRKSFSKLTLYLSGKCQKLYLNIINLLTGTDLSSSKHRQDKRPLSSEFDDLDDFGPETNIDTIDDVVLSPSVKNFDVDTVAIFKDSNPFLEHQQEKAELETQKIEQDKEEIKEEVDKFDDEERRLAREETPTPPADTGEWSIIVVKFSFDIFKHSNDL